MKQRNPAALIFSLTLVLAAAAYLYFASPQQQATKATAFDRVSQSKTIRCGYIVYEPYISKDPNTGKLSGVTVDYLNQSAARHGLKIEWTGEVNFDQIVPSLDAGKIDMVCVPCTPTTDFERVLAFVGNLGGLPYYAYVGAQSTIKREDLPKATFAVHDGMALTGITRNAYPDATFVSLPQTASVAEFFDQLKYGKAQAIITDNIGAANYMKNNSGTIRRLSDDPVIAMRMFLVAQKTDTRMHALIEKTFGLEDPANLADMKALVDRYHVPEGSLLLGDDCKPAVNEKGWKICAP